MMNQNTRLLQLFLEGKLDAQSRIQCEVRISIGGDLQKWLHIQTYRYWHFVDFIFQPEDSIYTHSKVTVGSAVPTYTIIVYPVGLGGYVATDTVVPVEPWFVKCMS